MEKKKEQQEVKTDIKDGEIISSEKTVKASKINLVWVLVLLLLCLNAGLYWLWYQQKSVNVTVEATLTELAASSAVDTFEQSLKTIDNKLQSQLTALKSEQATLISDLDTVRDSQQLSGADVEYYWVIAEVRYLLNVANQQVLLANDAIGASEAIELADTRIEALSDHRLHPLRALFADELLALSAVKKIDVEGMVLQLQSALLNVDKLQVLMATPVSDEENAGELLSSENWQSAFGQAWQQVKSLVVIRHQQDGAAAVLVPEQRYFLYQNLRLKLEAVRFALLMGEQATFDANLASAEQWLQQYFVGDERDAMMALVTELKGSDVRTEMPDISASLSWLRGFEQ